MAKDAFYSHTLILSMPCMPEPSHILKSKPVVLSLKTKLYTPLSGVEITNLPCLLLHFPLC